MKTLQELCGIPATQILQNICKTYAAAAIINLKENTVIEFHSIITEEKESYESENVDDRLNNFVNTYVDEDYRIRVTDFFDKTILMQLFEDESLVKSIEFKSIKGNWFNLELRPMIFENLSEKKLVLFTLKDITVLHRQIKALMETKHHSDLIADNYVRLFLNANEDVYSEIFKFNLSNGESTLINIKNGKINEAKLNNLQATYMYLLDRVHSDDKDYFMSKTDLKLIKDSEPGSRFTLTYRAKVPNSNEYHWFSMKITVSAEDSNALYQTSNKETRSALNMKYAGHKIVTFFIGDVNEEMQEKKELLSQSEHDELTGLFNRNKLDNMKKSEYKNLKSCGVMFLDVNNLKTTNDKYGHEAGDNLLNVAADSIRSLQNRRTHAYRYGGDEFIVIMPDCTEEEIAQNFRIWTERLANLVEETGIKCTVAVGSAWTDKDVNLDKLLQTADDRMYANKKKMKEGTGQEVR